MTNSIWNKYDIKDTPDENNLVVLVDKDDGFYNACFVDKIDWANDWYDHIEKWCYLDKLIAQADKAERLQKAVDFLSGHLRDVLQLDEYGHIKLDEITKQQILTSIANPVGIIEQLEKENQ